MYVCVYACMCVCMYVCGLCMVCIRLMAGVYACCAVFCVRICVCVGALLSGCAVWVLGCVTEWVGAVCGKRLYNED